MRNSFIVACFAFLSSALCAQTPLTVAPGLSITSTAIPWVVDHYMDKIELVPIHHSTVDVNNHNGANIAGSLAGSFFYKPKSTMEIPGVNARVTLHDSKPIFYFHLDQDSDSSGEGRKNDSSFVFGLVRATVTKDRRIFSKARFTQLTGHVKRSDGIIECETEVLPDGWMKLTPKQPLESGEYAFMPIFKNERLFATVIYDFSLNKNGPNATDAVVAQ